MDGRAGAGAGARFGTSGGRGTVGSTTGGSAGADTIGVEPSSAFLFWSHCSRSARPLMPPFRLLVTAHDIIRLGERQAAAQDEIGHAAFQNNGAGPAAVRGD